MAKRLGGSRLIVWYGAALHLAQAMAWLSDPDAGGATSLSVIARTFGEATPFVLSAASLVTVGALLIVSAPLLRLSLMLPQQFLLVLAAYAAYVAMLAGQYADGVPRPHAFIFADQIGYPLVAALHTVAMFVIALERNQP